MNGKIVGGLIGIALLIGIAVYYLSGEKPPEEQQAHVVYALDTKLDGDGVVPEDEIHRIADGATLIVDGDYTIAGTLDCNNSPLRLIVNGNLSVGGNMRCIRDAELADSDLGEGFVIVVHGEIDFKDTATVSTNGHIQLVTDVNELVDNQTEIDNVYDNVETILDVDGIFVVGPFIEIPIAEGQQVLLPLKQQSAISKLVTRTAHAQQPAVDNDGNVVPDTVRIGGKWVVGDPTKAPPKQIQVPTPPKKIKKILINWNFGPAGTVAINDLTLYGPDGRPGTEETGSCNVKGKTGNDAYRLNISAGNITINNFNLFLGSGGEGGFAETSKECEHGEATGGKGGKPGNFKMIAQNKFDIKGTFTINPGQGGTGGQAVAHGKNGADGCPAKNGGKATATGGEGGDNKKGLRVFGSVSGTSNVVIKSLIGGTGGDADANGGTGGIGTGCGCDGGLGGDATAIGGKGGTATSRTLESKGGDGGGVTSIPGKGGNGGTCDAKGPGGNGAKGGDASVTPGKPGTGRTSNGEEGTTWEETGGDGGDGGDGCNEGKGGKGGKGSPDGEDGKDGKNLCITPPEDSQLQVDPPTDETIIGNEEIPIEIVQLSLVSVKPVSVSFTYDHSQPKCPLQLPPIMIDGPPDINWNAVPQDGFPIWLQPVGPLEGQGPGQVRLQFPCQLDTYNNQQQSAGLHVNVFTPDVGELNQHIDINGNFTNFNDQIVP